MTQRMLNKFLVAAGLCLAVAMPVQADVSAVQCCMLRDGKYIPGLRIDFGESEVEVVIGERGLTPSNLYRSDKVEAYIQQAFQTGDQDINVSLNCGAVKGDEARVFARMPGPPLNDDPVDEPTDRLDEVVE